MPNWLDWNPNPDWTDWGLGDWARWCLCLYVQVYFPWGSCECYYILIWGPDVLGLVREGSYQIERVRSRLAQIVIGAVGSLESRVLRSTIPLLLCGDTI